MPCTYDKENLLYLLYSSDDLFGKASARFAVAVVQVRHSSTFRLCFGGGGFIERHAGWRVIFVERVIIPANKPTSYQLGHPRIISDFCPIYHSINWANRTRVHGLNKCSAIGTRHAFTHCCVSCVTTVSTLNGLVSQHLRRTVTRAVLSVPEMLQNNRISQYGFQNSELKEDGMECSDGRLDYPRVEFSHIHDDKS